MEYRLGCYNTDGSLEHLITVNTKESAENMYKQLKEDYRCTIWVQKIEFVDPKEEFEAKTQKRKYNVILKFGDYTIISYKKKHIGVEYVIARNFNAEEFSWDSASNNYAYSLESALAMLLLRFGKSQRQLEIERNTGITFDRACELASKFKDGLFGSDLDEEEYNEFFLDECEMDEKELDFFGIKTESRSKRQKRFGRSFN